MCCGNLILTNSTAAAKWRSLLQADNYSGQLPKIKMFRNLAAAVQSLHEASLQPLALVNETPSGTQSFAWVLVIAPDIEESGTFIISRQKINGDDAIFNCPSAIFRVCSGLY
jgi:hypothetical protein